jgi:hypothetical protein
MESKEIASAMKNSGLPTAVTPELNPNFQMDTLYLKELVADSKVVHNISGGDGHQKQTHIVMKGGKKQYVVRVESGKKYVNKDKQKVFLSKIKGKYNYV